ncbi:hypothetical protein CHD2B1_039 [Escherichia phage vB_EcoS-CHD2B1]|nr:hypothetical protein CHD2B1_039 [Escherichia phage vB_EcoS-CHD2B1]
MKRDKTGRPALSRFAKLHTYSLSLHKLKAGRAGRPDPSSP